MNTPQKNHQAEFSTPRPSQRSGTNSTESTHLTHHTFLGPLQPVEDKSKVVTKLIHFLEANS